MSPRTSGLGKREGFSTSALWFDYDRDGLLDLFVCNYVKWSPEHDVFLQPRWQTQVVLHARGLSRRDLLAVSQSRRRHVRRCHGSSGIFDSSSKSLGVALLDYDHDGWPDLLVANDTQPNKLYRNQRNGTFEDVAVEAGLAFSSEGKARAGMGVDVGRFRQLRRARHRDHQLR